MTVDINPLGIYDRMKGWYRSKKKMEARKYLKAIEIRLKLRLSDDQKKMILEDLRANRLLLQDRKQKYWVIFQSYDKP